MAKAPKEAASESEGEEVLTVEPSELDERTHAEMLTLFGASTNQIQFAKHQQWGTLLGTLGLRLGAGGVRTARGPFCVGRLQLQVRIKLTTFEAGPSRWQTLCDYAM